jgi:hypothetical protein
MLLKNYPEKKCTPLPLHTRIIFAGIALICLFSSTSLHAQGDLFINPKRIVFEGQKHFQDIYLANTGQDTARYIVSFIQIRMKDDGSFEQIEKPDSGQNFADNFLRIFPRRVVLAPKETQVIKIQVSRTNKLIPGEYRSHLYFRSVPKQNPLGEITKEIDTKSLSVKLTPVYGISIPVIIRTGENNAKVSISNLKLEKANNGTPVLSLRFNRTGNMSVYGDISIEQVSASGKITPAGFIKGVSVYTPNKLRDTKIILNAKSEINYKSGKLRVVYSNSTDGKTEKLASAELLLN